MPRIEDRPPASMPRTKSVHTVDWTTLRQIRLEACKRSSFSSSEEMAVSGEELAECWLAVAEVEQLRQGCSPLSPRDREFIEIRVTQSMREVDPQCSGQVDIDIWVHHMLLTRSSPPVMRAMLQINRLLEVSLHSCPGILVGLQHAFEVALPSEPPPPEVAGEDTPAGAGARLPFSEVIGIYGRKLWHLRPGTASGTKECPVKRRTDFSYRTPDEFIRNTVKAMDLDESGRVSPADFLALCLGRREWQVSLHLYDLSRGIAQVLSPWLLKEQLEGVWHTGIVVYGKEYYFGGDIYYDTPAKTGFGTPRIAIHLGTTLRQKDELHAFIVDELKPLFTREAYDAARNNCNHFTDRVSMYLVGKHIPEEVLRQPELMMHSRLGRTLRPILTKVLGQYFEPKGSAEEISRGGQPGTARSADQAALALQNSEGGQEDIWNQTVTL